MSPAADGSIPNPNQRRRSALILAGAAAKGPYAAGALTQIARDRRFHVSVVVGASSGALNAAVYAAGLRAGREQEAAQYLTELWADKANLRAILSFNRRKEIVTEAVNRFADSATKADVQVHVVVASLPGVRDGRGYVRAEETFVFDNDALTSPAKIDRLAQVCVASAALPVLFRPRKVEDGGPYWDGGIVNNTPLGWALRTDRDIDHVLVVTPDENRLGTGRYGRLSVGRLLEMVTDERLNRDLVEARSFNDEILKLKQLGVSLPTMKAELKWRLLQILEVRPAEELRGGLAAGFLSKSRREEYSRVGSASASSALEAWREQVFP